MKSGFATLSYQLYPVVQEQPILPLAEPAPVTFPSAPPLQMARNSENGSNNSQDPCPEKGMLPKNGGLEAGHNVAQGQVVVVRSSMSESEKGHPSENPNDLLRVGRYCAFISKIPWVMMLLVFCSVLSFVYFIGTPGYFAFFEGGEARSSMEAQVNDAFFRAQDFVKEQRDAEEKDAKVSFAKRESPFSVENFRESITFYFESKSGHTLSSENVATQLFILDGAARITRDFCHRGGDNATCERPYSLMRFLGSEKSTEIQERLNDEENYDKEDLTYYLGSDADFQTGLSSWAKGRVAIGGPLPGFHNLSHLAENQTELYEAEYKLNGSMGAPSVNGWIAEINSLIQEAAETNSDLRVYYVGGNNLLPRMFSGLNIDMMFAMAAVGLVGCFMWLQLGSILLTFAGMFQILASWFVALSMWKVLGNGSFTFMHCLVIYIILGIGADNVFVFADAWKQSRAQGPRVNGTAATRLQWTLSKSFRAMLVTSATTCAAFMLTSLTDMPIIATFGTFASLVIAVNFLFVISWFPACVLFHHRCFVASCTDCCAPAPAARLCACCCTLCAGQWGLAAPNSVGVHLEDAEGQQPPRQAQAQLRLAERFFSGPWCDLLQHRWARLSILAAFMAVGVAGMVCAGTGVQLTKKAISETILVEGHPLQQTLNLWLGNADSFRATDDDRKEFGTWMFGVDGSGPIDREGTDPLAEDQLENLGQPVFSGADLGSEAAQQMLVEACEAMKALPSVAIDPEREQPEVYCFMSDFRAYRTARALPFPVPREELVAALGSWRADVDCSGEGCYRDEEETGVSQGTLVPGMYDERTGYLVEGETIKFAFISGNLSLDAMEQDMSLIVPEYEEWREGARAFGEEQGVGVIGLTGRLGWIAIMQALIRGAAAGIPASLGIACVVLILSTGNLRVALIASMTILGVMSSFFIAFVASNWVLGMYECMFLQLTAGMAVDYVVHLAHAYNESQAESAGERMRDSLREMGVSVLSGAVSTLAASALLFACSFNLFYLYGSFIFYVILWAIVWALIFFPAAMTAFGPEGDCGDITLLKRLYATPRPASAAPTQWSARTGQC